MSDVSAGSACHIDTGRHRRERLEDVRRDPRMDAGVGVNNLLRSVVNTLDQIAVQEENHLSTASIFLDPVEELKPATPDPLLDDVVFPVSVIEERTVRGDERDRRSDVKVGDCEEERFVLFHVYSLSMLRGAAFHLSRGQHSEATFVFPAAEIVSPTVIMTRQPHVGFDPSVIVLPQ